MIGVIEVMPEPYAFPVRSKVKGGATGTVIEILGPFSVKVRRENGSVVSTTTTDLQLSDGEGDEAI